MAAQPHVWRDKWRARRFSLWSNKRWLWVSLTHRQFGTLAFAASLAAYATGVAGWSGMGRWESGACLAALALLVKGVLNRRSAAEAAQAIQATAIAPVRASQAIATRAARMRSRPPLGGSRATC